MSAGDGARRGPSVGSLEAPAERGQDGQIGLWPIERGELGGGEPAMLLVLVEARLATGAARGSSSPSSA